MELLLSAFLREAAAAPFAYGEWDCAITLARWIECATGRDPAPELRGRYATRFGWLRIVSRAGGLDALVGRLALAAGLKVRAPDELAAGDIGVVALPTLERGQAGAIFTGKRWAMKLTDGLTAGNPELVRAWGLR